MKVEWDDAKRKRTLSERGLDFADVGLNDWDTAIIIDDTRRVYGEPRKVVMGLLQERLVIVAFTMRGPALRVISMRKANSREVKLYESFKA